MKINVPDILAEVEEAFAAYEAALMTNDLEGLDALFWRDKRTIRFGPGQNLYGIEQISAFRAARTGGSPQRALSNTVITTLGTDFATTNTEFSRQGDPRLGRQCQSWVRT